VADWAPSGCVTQGRKRAPSACVGAPVFGMPSPSRRPCEVRAWANAISREGSISTTISSPSDMNHHGDILPHVAVGQQCGSNGAD